MKPSAQSPARGNERLSPQGFQNSMASEHFHLPHRLVFRRLQRSSSRYSGHCSSIAPSEYTRLVRFEFGKGPAMPRVEKTILPRIRKSLQTRGVVGTIWRCILGPYTLLRQYRKSRKRFIDYRDSDEFDRQHGIETTKRVHLTDLEIESPNWIYADGYWPTPPEIFRDALSGLTSKPEDLIFIDFGSGKGRVLLMASEYPFRKIVGVEFAQELHAVAEQNIRSYRSATQKCQDVTSVYAGLHAVLYSVGPAVRVPLQSFVARDHKGIGSQHRAVCARASARAVGFIRDSDLRCFRIRRPSGAS